MGFPENYYQLVNITKKVEEWEEKL
jgi:hypothetical protein